MTSSSVTKTSSIIHHTSNIFTGQDPHRDTLNTGSISPDASPLLIKQKNKLYMQEKDITSTNEIKIFPHGIENGESQITRVRDDRIDAVKFWLVTLVIAVHVFMRKEFSDSTACAVIWNWINLFVMPLFIFISGYFSRKKDKKDIFPSIWKLLEPLIIFQAIALLFYKDSITMRDFITPWYMLWYLLSLIYWRLILQFIPNKILNHTKLIIFSTFYVSILAGFFPFDRVLSIQRTFALMPLFFCGYYFRDKNLYLPDKYNTLCIVFLFVILAVLFFYPHRITYLLYATPYKSIYGVVIRVVAFILAIPMSIAFINVCYNTPWIAQQGRMSMQYYIYHALVIPPMSAPIIPPLILIADKMNVPMTFYTAIVIIILTIIGLSLILKIPHVKMLTNPSSLIVKILG